MKKICVICATVIANDPRVLRQVMNLKEHYDVTVIGHGVLNLPGARFIPWKSCHLPSPNKLIFAKRCISYYFGDFKEYLKRFTLANNLDLQGKPFDLVLVNEAPSLALGFLIANNSPVICDLHENYLEIRHPGIKPLLRARYLRWLCRTYLPRCTTLTTVSSGLADYYRRLSGKETVVIPNTPPFESLPVTEVESDHIRLIHHGFASPTRQIHLMIEMMDYVDKRFTLDLMLTGNSNYRQKLLKLAYMRKNVRWREPVPMTDICKEINQYDMGIYIIPPVNHNTKFCLPNKFFEFIQARLGVAIGPSVEMAPLVQKHQIGIVANDFNPKSLASKLNSLTNDDVKRFKENANNLALTYNAETSLKSLLQIVDCAVN